MNPVLSGWARTLSATPSGTGTVEPTSGVPATDTVTISMYASFKFVTLILLVQ